MCLDCYRPTRIVPPLLAVFTSATTRKFGGIKAGSLNGLVLTRIGAGWALFAALMFAALMLAPAIAAAQGSGPPAPQRSGPKDVDFQTRVQQEGGPQYQPEDAGKLVVEVRIEGNETVADNAIYAQLRTRKDRRFDPEVVQADVRRLISDGKVRHVRTFTEDVAGGVIVTFRVVELPTIRFVHFQDNRAYLEKTLLRQSGLKINDPLNRFAVSEGRRRVEEYYHDKGYSKARVTVLQGNKSSDRGVVYQVSEGVRERVAKVQFVGNTFASSSRLRTLVRSKSTILWTFRGVVERDKIEEDVERLTAYYRSFGFFRARIGRELLFGDSGKWLTLKFVIDEGPRYRVREVSVKGNQKFTTQSLMEQLELNAGEHFNLAKMNRDVNSLRDAYGIQGHIFADIQAEPIFHPEPGSLDLVYSVEEGEAFRVGKINVHIAGEAPHTRRSVVFNRLSIKPGDLCNIREIRHSERRLISSQLFEHNPAMGISPKIVIQPPDLTEIERLSRDNRVRGQSPDRTRYR